MAVEKRTVLVAEISYEGTDGESHIAHAGDEITLSPAGAAHFDWVHDATPEARHAATLAAEAGTGKKAAAPVAVDGKKA